MELGFFDDLKDFVTDAAGYTTGYKLFTESGGSRTDAELYACQIKSQIQRDTNSRMINSGKFRKCDSSDGMYKKGDPIYELPLADKDNLQIFYIETPYGDWFAKTIVKGNYNPENETIVGKGNDRKSAGDDLVRLVREFYRIDKERWLENE